MHVAEAKRRLKSQVPWLCDTISNDLRHAVGTAPNAEFILDPDGKVLVARVWSEPEQLRKDLEEIIGPIDNPTREEDLDLERIPPPEPVATGVVEKLQVPARMRPLVIEPDLTRVEEIPFYAKAARRGRGRDSREGHRQALSRLPPGPSLRGPLEQRSRPCEASTSGLLRESRSRPPPEKRPRWRPRPTVTPASSCWMSRHPTDQSPWT